MSHITILSLANSATNMIMIINPRLHTILFFFISLHLFDLYKRIPVNKR